MKKNGAQIVIAVLEEQGIDTVFGIPGGSNLPLYDALSESRIMHILARHEQGAGFMAQGMARSTGRPAVCFATSGPGAANLVTAIADAMHDSVPLIAVTGQVSAPLIGTNAFQEVDFCSITQSITKKNFLIKDAADIEKVMRQAFSIATSGRPGPVVIDIPKNIFLQTAEFTPARKAEKIRHTQPDMQILQKAAAMINNSRRPVILAGGGIIHSGAHHELKELAEKNSIPVALTLMGLGCFDPENTLALGMIGMHGTQAANTVSEEADLLIALGTRFGDRSTGIMSGFFPGAKVLHIDIDPAELGKLRQTDLSIEGDLHTILTPLNQLVEENMRTQWVEEAAQRARRSRSENKNHPSHCIRAICDAAPPDAIITTDVGQHQMWTAQSYTFTRPRSLLTSGGLGTMGFGLPAAIGAALAHPGRRIICITGDGSLQMNIQELATLAELNLPVSIFLMNNRHLGLVRQQQDLFYKGNRFASRFDVTPDFSIIAEGYGIRTARMENLDEVHRYIGQAFSYNGPFFAELMIDADAHVLPMVPPGMKNSQMIGMEFEPERETIRLHCR